MPPWMCGMPDAIDSAAIGMWPPSRSVIAGAAPLYGTCTALKLPGLLQQLDGEVRERAVACRAVGDRLPGSALAAVTQSFRVLYFESAAAMNRNGELATWITGVRSFTGSMAGALHGRRDDHVVDLAHHDVVTLVARARRLLQADHAAGARLVLDHDGPAGRLGELLATSRDDGVGAAARGERHDQADGLGRISSARPRVRRARRAASAATRSEA